MNRGAGFGRFLAHDRFEPIDEVDDRRELLLREARAILCDRQSKRVEILAGLLLAVVATLPRWRYSRGWGSGPAWAVGVLLQGFVMFWYVLGLLAFG